MSDETSGVFTVSSDEIDPQENTIAAYYVCEAGVKIAAEESIGTWIEVTTVTDWIIRSLQWREVLKDHWRSTV